MLMLKSCKKKNIVYSITLILRVEDAKFMRQSRHKLVEHFMLITAQVLQELHLFTQPNTRKKNLIETLAFISSAFGKSNCQFLFAKSSHCLRIKELLITYHNEIAKIKKPTRIQYDIEQYYFERSLLSSAFVICNVYKYIPRYFFRVHQFHFTGS